MFSLRPVLTSNVNWTKVSQGWVMRKCDSIPWASECIPVFVSLYQLTANLSLFVQIFGPFYDPIKKQKYEQSCFAEPCYS